jgi:excisionase family DNA binding protein
VAGVRRLNAASFFIWITSSRSLTEARPPSRIFEPFARNATKAAAELSILVPHKSSSESRSPGDLFELCSNLLNPKRSTDKQCPVVVHQPKRRAPKCQLVGPKGESIALPESVFYVLERVAEVLARGDSITIVPVGRELTTQQAADLLNVSRQYLVRLLDEGRIAFRKTGKHRRLRIEDVLDFKDKRDKDRRAGLRELSQMTQEFGGYDSELK